MRTDIERNATAMVSADNLPAGKEKTYTGFTTLLKWSVPIIGITALVVILLIS